MIHATANTNGSFDRISLSAPGHEFANILARYVRYGWLDVDAFVDLLEAEHASISVVPHANVLRCLAQEYERLQEFSYTLDKRLYPYQRDGAVFMYRKPGCILADEMGLGKTVQALCALEYKAAAVVVAPSGLLPLWVRETRAWRPDMRVTEVTAKVKYLNEWPKPGEIMFCSYGRLPRYPEILGYPKYPIHIIADEADYLRNYGSARTVNFRALVQQANTARRVWLLTGTPIVNSPQDLWRLLQASKLEYRYGGRDGFDKAFGGGRTVSGYVWGKPTPHALPPLRSIYLRREKSDVLDLPPKYRKTVLVDILANGDSHILDQADREITVELEAGRDPLVRLSTHITTARRILANSKVDAALDYVSNLSERFLVFTTFREVAARMCSELGTGVKLLDGSVPLKEREVITQDFQSGMYRGLVATIGSCARGLTLTRATHVVYVDKAWTNAENDQAGDRVHRISQTMPVTITDLVSKHRVDRRINQLLKAKKKYSSILDDVQTPNRLERLATAKRVFEEYFYRKAQ